jgi:hypothetical protein
MIKKSAIGKIGYDIISFSDTAGTAVNALLTVQDVAKLLRCSVSSLNKWRLIGQGPVFVRIGSRVRYRGADVAAYIAEQTRTSTSATEAPVA